jgi:MFS family permease
MGEILESPTGSTIVAAMAPADARGRYQGARSMMVGAGFFVAPKLGTWVWEREGPDLLWASCLALGVVLALVLAVTGPALRRRMAR